MKETTNNTTESVTTESVMGYVAEHTVETPIEGFNGSKAFNLFMSEIMLDMVVKDNAMHEQQVKIDGIKASIKDIEKPFKTRIREIEKPFKAEISYKKKTYGTMWAESEKGQQTIAEIREKMNTATEQVRKLMAEAKTDLVLELENAKEEYKALERTDAKKRIVKAFVPDKWVTVTDMRNDLKKQIEDKWGLSVSDRQMSYLCPSNLDKDENAKGRVKNGRVLREWTPREVFTQKFPSRLMQLALNKGCVTRKWISVAVKRTEK